jgi:hypothetical protein
MGLFTRVYLFSSLPQDGVTVPSDSPRMVHRKLLNAAGFALSRVFLFGNPTDSDRPAARAGAYWSVGPSIAQVLVEPGQIFPHASGSGAIYERSL